MNLLKQNTAITLRYGPFLDDSDGNTPETGLTISQADVRLSKAGGAFAQKNESSSATHDENGWYSISLNTTDTNTVGILRIAIHESGALPVFESLMVVPANVYDSLVGGTDYLQTDIIQVSGSTEDIATETKQDVIDGNVDSILEDTGTTIPATLSTIDGIVDDILVDTGTTIPNQISGLNDLSAAEVNAEVDTALSDYDAATGTELATIDSKIDTIDGNVDSILIDTGTTIPAQLDSMSGATFNSSTDSLEAIRNRGDVAWTTGAGGSAPTVEQIRTEMDNNSTMLSDILADTNELQSNQGSWATATGFATEAKQDIIDANVDSVLTDTGTTIPAQISGLNDISSAEVNAACDTALTDYDAATGTELAAIDTKIDTIDGVVDSILTDTGTTLPASIAALNDISPAEVNAEVVDALNVDTYAEPGQGAPPATASIATKLNYLYKSWRNKKTATATAFNIYNDAGDTIDHKSTVSDDGTTATVGELGTGA